MRAVIVVLVVCAASFAIAKPPEEPTVQAMREAFQEGTTSYNLGHYEEALAAFERGYRVKNDPAFLFNIGQCQRQLGRPRDAARSYRAFLRESPSVPEPQLAEVQRLIGLMDDEVARSAANAPPTGVSAPVGEPPPSPPATTTTTTAPAANPLVESPPPPPRRRALWIGLGVGAGVVAAGLAIGLGVGLSHGSSPPAASLGNTPVSFR